MDKQLKDITVDELWIARGKEQELFEQCQRNIAAIRQELALRQEQENAEDG